MRTDLHDDDTVETLGSAIQRMREARHLSRAKLGRLVGVTGAQILRYERDENQPTLSTAARLAQAFSCTLDELAGREIDGAGAAA